ncbi:hypothetical protein pb186bvf_011581 [Paramecium bursaria]
MTTQDLSMPKVQDQPQTTTDEQKVDLQWSQLTVTLINQKQNANKVSQNDPLLNHCGEKFILNNLTGSAKAGELTAVMGPSGAGKTTLVACLSKRFKRQANQTFQGEILANNIPYTKYHEFGGFVMQDDLLMATLTVKGTQNQYKQETFLFVAQLRLQCDLAQRLSIVDQVIRDLKLRNCQNTYVGDALIKGISGGERKRTSIGIELISNPQVLILDEPTSGLDSFTAFICMNILKQIAKNQQRTIIFTIHQPSADIYNLFDKLIILNHGQTVYQGQADQLIKYISRLGLDVDTFNNPIDVAMNNLTKFNKEDQIAALTYEKYQLYLQRDAEKTDVKSYGYNARKNETTFFYELKILMWRQFLNFSRNPNLLRSKIIGAIFVSIFLSCLYWNIGNDDAKPPEAPTETSRDKLLPYLMNFTGGLFVCGTSAIFSALGPLLMIFPIERNIFLKEENSKMYRVSAYYISKVALEVPINVFIQICITLFLYWSYALIWEFQNLSEFVLIAVLVSLCGNGIGIFTGCLFPDAKKSASLGPIVLLPLQLFGGQASNLANLPSFIKWVQYISPFKYFLEGFGRTQLDGVRFALPGDPDVDPSAFLGRVTGLWTCIYVLAGLAIGFHILGGIFLKLLVNKINV